MANTDTIDARGLSCPQPILLTSHRIFSMQAGTFTVLVDTITQKENVVRVAENLGWATKSKQMEENGEFELVISK
jgi:tRNA 2-thiouridine synthesizing protein A